MVRFSVQVLKSLQVTPLILCSRMTTTTIHRVLDHILGTISDPSQSSATSVVDDCTATSAQLLMWGVVVVGQL